MAYVETIWVHNANEPKQRMKVYCKMKPSGKFELDIDLPESFLKALTDIAQKAADTREALMRAEILGDEYKPTPATEGE